MISPQAGAGIIIPRLIEADLPIKRISEFSSREKSIRHGHISTFHVWWARRPLGACRAVLLASILPDPASPLCPAAFSHAAALRMAELRDRRGGRQRKWADGLELRAALLDFIADYADWENALDEDFNSTARALVQIAHESMGGTKGSRPLIVDPFAGGGAIPLEALRIGADAFASDLNPVALLQNRVLLEYAPKYGQRLPAMVRKWGLVVGEELERRTSTYYPRAKSAGPPVAFIWARQVQCTGPGCGAKIPLIRSLVLARRGKKSIALKFQPNRSLKRVDVTLQEVAGADAAGDGTVRRGSATCPVCEYTTPVSNVRAQLMEQRGGADTARLLCVVSRLDSGGKSYRLPAKEDEEALERAHSALRDFEAAGQIPDEVLPVMSGVFNAPLYGITRWSYLFAPRQLVAICTLNAIIDELRLAISKECGDAELTKAVVTCLFLARDKSLDFWTTLCSWISVGEKIGHTFGRQALGMVWDFAEGVPVSDMSGSWLRSVEYLAEVLDHCAKSIRHAGTTSLSSATSHPLPDDSALALVTDPPYYNAVPYADLSDFFYVWLRRSCAKDHPDLFSSALAPKEEELCEMSGWDPVRYPHKDAAFYEAGMGRALAEGRRVVVPNGIAVVVFAHKTTAGWETLLGALIAAGWTVTASWPIDTERGARLRAMGSAALGSSIHLVCRPREHADGSVRDEVGDWRDVVGVLPGRIHEWMPRLAAEGVVGADAIFACLGPALELYSRYSRVEKASGAPVPLSEYLEHVWAAVAKEALTMIFAGADATGFEEDARLTAMWLWTLAEGGAGGDDSLEGTSDADEEAPGKANASGFALEYDAARKIAQGLGVDLAALSSLVEVKGSSARLRAVTERTRSLFGRQESEAPTNQRKARSQQLALGFVAEIEAAEERGGWGEKGAPAKGATVLDRVHQGMILFAAGRADALKRFLVDDGVGRDNRFWRLAQSLSALYPAATDEKRWVDGVLARKKGLGF